ncbi:MAG: amidase family protein, partial [Proteobacteria bacterium]|nr:amidase family protein [Pseudomonadota bacterium]
AQALSNAGYEVEETEPPAVVEAAALWSSLVFSEIRTVMLPVMRPLLSRDAATFLDLALASVPALDLLGYQTALAARSGIARQWTQFHDRYPLVLGPVSTAPPFPIGTDIASQESVARVVESMRLVLLVNLLGLPAASVPVGVGIDDGLPQGVQLIGDRYQESRCLDAAQAIEERVGTITPIDPVF